MPVLLDWLIEGEVIYHYWWDIGTIEDVHFVNETTLQMYEQYPERSAMHTVVDSLDQTKVDANLLEIRQSYTIVNHPRTGWAVMALPNPFMRFAANFLFQFGLGDNTRMRMLKNPEACIKFLKDVDRSINWAAMDVDLPKRLRQKAQEKKAEL